MKLLSAKTDSISRHKDKETGLKAKNASNRKACEQLLLEADQKFCIVIVS